MAGETKLRICPLCEATCGLALTVEDGRVTRVRGDADDAFSEGYLCPKGVAIAELHEDPDRLRAPLMRDGDAWREADWDDAYAAVEKGLRAVIEEHGRSAVGVYVGNPSVHNVGLALYLSAVIQSLDTPNVYSAATVDQRPKELASAMMFGSGLSIPVPDLDRCQYLLMLGANPLESNGSLMTAPNVEQRLRRIKKRGGKLTVLDPRNTKTARLADEYIPIRPGTDALFLMSIVHVLFEENLTKPGRLAEITSGIEEVRAACKLFSPELVADRCGIPAETIRTIARDLAAAESAAVYARMGSCTQEFGTLASWLPEVIHVLTGNLDRDGGAMFTLPAHGGANSKGAGRTGRGLRMGRKHSRVRNRPELFGQFPVAGLAEEIEMPGEGQIRAMICIGGNPILSTPNGDRLDRAFASLDFMVSLDIYRNETSRHADVILPGLSPLEVPHYDVAFATLSIQNHARFSPRVFEKPEGMREEWESLLRLAAIAASAGSGGPAINDVEMLDDFFIRRLIERESALETSPIHGRDTDDIIAALGDARGPERVLDFMLRTGPYGEGFGKDPDGLSLDKVKKHPHGVSLGPLKPRLPEALRTPSGTIELAPALAMQDVARLQQALESGAPEFTLVGRRDLRSNNSWMHNLPSLVSGKPRCTVHIHPDDAAEHGIENGDGVEVRSRVGAVIAAAEITEDIMRGVVSLPHGWGHDMHGANLHVAEAHAGVNSNRLTDEEVLDEPSGTAVLNGIPVTIAKAEGYESGTAGTAASGAAV